MFTNDLDSNSRGHKIVPLFICLFVFLFCFIVFSFFFFLLFYIIRARVTVCFLFSHYLFPNVLFQILNVCLIILPIFLSANDRQTDKQTDRQTCLVDFSYFGLSPPHNCRHSHGQGDSKIVQTKSDYFIAFTSC